MLPVAEMVGTNRIMPGNGIVHPTGDAERTPEEERRIRRRLVEEALTALTQR
jgi:glycine reductase